MVQGVSHLTGVRLTFLPQGIVNKFYKVEQVIPPTVTNNLIVNTLGP